MKPSVLKYAYISARVRGLKTRLLRRDDIYALLGCKDLHEIVRYLETTTYRKEIEEISIDKLNALVLERALIKNFLRTMDTIIEESPKHVRDIIIEFIRKLDINNLKIILRAKEYALSPLEIAKYLLPLREFNEDVCSHLLERSMNIEDIIEMLKGTIYYKVLKPSLTEYRIRDTLLPIEIALDKFVYERLWNRSRKLRGLDRKVAEEILGTEVDTINIKTTLRCKLANMDVKTLRRFLLPMGYILRERDFIKAFSREDIESCFRTLAIYPYNRALMRGLDSYSKTKSLLRLEIELERILLETSRNICRKYPHPFHIGIVLSFINLKWFEVRNLRAIVVGKEAKVPAERIERILVY
ncbi:MAG: ATP synthase A1 subunit C [Thermoprotei archaeon]|nr:MAG: ATP synthase A1 subunit C [Thermoprotei archaeon]